jgi:hypothetical protein
VRTMKQTGRLNAGPCSDRSCLSTKTREPENEYSSSISDGNFVKNMTRQPTS